jgi:hypothetical protein
MEHLTTFEGEAEPHFRGSIRLRLLFPASSVGWQRRGRPGGSDPWRGEAERRRGRAHCRPDCAEPHRVLEGAQTVARWRRTGARGGGAEGARPGQRRGGSQGGRSRRHATLAGHDGRQEVGQREPMRGSAETDKKGRRGKVEKRKRGK